MLSIKRWEATLIFVSFWCRVCRTGRLPRSWPAGQDRGKNLLFDEFAHAFVNGFVVHQSGVRDARRFVVGGTAQSDARVGIDDFVARRPPGAVADRPGRLVA